MKKLLLIFLCITIIFNGLIVMAEETEVKISSGYRHIAVLNIYGRVHASGVNTEGQCDVYAWENVRDICTGKNFTAALFEDGTVKTTNGKIDTTGFCNIIKIDAGDNFVAALDNSGYVYIAGDAGEINVENWENIEYISTGREHIIGILKTGEVVGSGKGMPTQIIYQNIERIYSGADMSVLIDSEGRLYHLGIGTYQKSADSDKEDVWVPTTWEGSSIKKIEIIEGSSNNGIVVALFNDGRVVSDGENDEMWKVNCAEISGAEDISVTISVEHPAIVVLNNDMTLNAYGISEGGFIQKNWKEDIEKIKPTKKPITRVEKTKIALGYDNLAIVLPDNTMKVFGNGVGNDLENVDTFTYMMANDEYVYTDIYGNIKTSISVSENNADGYTWDTLLDVSKWKGVEKLATYRWDGTEDLITGMRWDGKVFSSNSKDNILKNNTDVIEIVGGRYFTGLLNSDGTVKVYSTQNNTDFTEVESWTGIVKLFAGYDQIIGIKEDGTCVAAGGNILVDGVYGESMVEEWRNIVSAVGAGGFTVGLQSDGKCVVAETTDTTSLLSKKAKIAKAEIEDEKIWNNIKNIYSSETCVVGHKNDGTFIVHLIRTKADNITRPEFLELERVYYKDGEYFYNKTDSNKISIEYMAANDKEMYITIYGENGEIAFEKKKLASSTEVLLEEYTYEDAQRCYARIKGMNIGEMPIFMECLVENRNLKVNYIADSDKKIVVAFYDSDDNMTNVCVKTITACKEMSEIVFAGDCDATKYKLLMWNGMTPAYKEEGLLN